MAPGTGVDDLAGKPGEYDLYEVLRVALTKALERDSSDVVWCESEVHKYAHSRSIAEFYNSVSNAIFFVFPPLFFVVWRNYACHVNAGCNLVWGLLMVVGFGSFYFHATLSLVGQLIDELAILWVILVAVATWVHLDMVFPSVRLQRCSFKSLCYVFAAASSVLNSTYPVINRVFLFSLAVPIVSVLVIQVRRSTNPRVHVLTVKALAVYLIAVASWIGDRFYCEFWTKRAHFPYLHAIWHVLVFMSCYSTCVIFAYFDAIYEAESLRPDIMYWPSDDMEWLGIPYIGLRVSPSTAQLEENVSAASGVVGAFSPPSKTVVSSGAVGPTTSAPAPGVAASPGVVFTQEFYPEVASSSSSTSRAALKAVALPMTTTKRPLALQRRTSDAPSHSHSD